jgi:hypothetical protein
LANEPIQISEKNEYRIEKWNYVFLQ